MKQVLCSRFYHLYWPVRDLLFRQYFTDLGIFFWVSKFALLNQKYRPFFISHVLLIKNWQVKSIFIYIAQNPNLRWKALQPVQHETASVLGPSTHIAKQPDASSSEVWLLTSFIHVVFTPRPPRLRSTVLFLCKNQSQGITKGIINHPEADMNVCTKFHGNSSNSSNPFLFQTNNVKLVEMSGDHQRHLVTRYYTV